jgi:hypothetical protein
MRQILPVTSDPYQKLSVSLSVDDQVLNLNLVLSYNEIAGYWTVAISDAAGNLLVDSLPLITGVWPAANLLGQFGYLKIGSLYVLNISWAEEVAEQEDWPTMDEGTEDELGTDFIVVWGDTAA